MMKRERFGIDGMDDMVDGGLPSRSVIGILGSAGIGKSILSLHFLLQGARKGQKVLYINNEEPEENIRRMIMSFSFADEFFEYQKKGLIKIKCFKYKSFENMYDEILVRIKKDKKIRRLVIDSFNLFFISSNTPVARMVTRTLSTLRETDITSLLILEKISTSNDIVMNLPYRLDGIIELDLLDFGRIERRIFIPKMRWTRQYGETKSFEITNKGFVVR